MWIRVTLMMFNWKHTWPIMWRIRRMDNPVRRRILSFRCKFCIKRVVWVCWHDLSLPYKRISFHFVVYWWTKITQMEKDGWREIDEGTGEVIPTFHVIILDKTWNRVRVSEWVPPVLMRSKCKQSPLLHSSEPTLTLFSRCSKIYRMVWLLQ